MVWRNKVQSALVTLAPAVERVESLRAARKIPHYVLCAAARVHPTTWFYLRRGEQEARRETIERLEKGLAGLLNKDYQPRPVNVIEVFVRLAEGVVRKHIGGNRVLMRALTPDRVRRGKARKLPTAIEAGRLRRLAIYLAAVELEVGNAEIACALGLTRQGVHKARGMIEALRDSPAIDGLLERCRLELKGEAT